jgi:hypothetical protein
MDAYADLVVRDVLMEEHGLSREVAMDLVRRNAFHRAKSEKELRSILQAWVDAGLLA